MKISNQFPPPHKPIKQPKGNTLHRFRIGFVAVLTILGLCAFAPSAPAHVAQGSQAHCLGFNVSLDSFPKGNWIITGHATPSSLKPTRTLTGPAGTVAFKWSEFNIDPGKLKVIIYGVTWTADGGGSYYKTYEPDCDPDTEDTTIPPTTVKPTTTLAPTTTVKPTTTLAPTTTVTPTTVPATTVAPTTTAAPVITTTLVPVTTVVSTTTPRGSVPPSCELPCLPATTIAPITTVTPATTAVPATTVAATVPPTTVRSAPPAFKAECLTALNLPCPTTTIAAPQQIVFPAPPPPTTVAAPVAKAPVPTTPTVMTVPVVTATPANPVPGTPTFTG